MRTRSSKTEFLALLAFMISLGIVLTNGLSARIYAQADERILFEKIEPIGDVLAEIMRNYVYEPDLDKTVEGALIGIMSTLDRNSSYISPQGLKSMREDTEGAFFGIGVHIKYNNPEDRLIMIVQPIPDQPASRAGLRSDDLIIRIDGVSAEGMDLAEAARRIKGPRGQIVKIGILRRGKDDGPDEELEFDVKRDKIPVKSILEARVLDGGIGYLRVSDFKKNTAKEMKEAVETFKSKGMKSLVVDLRWNPGGLLSASREVSQLFLPKNTLVTYTRGRVDEDGGYRDEMKLRTEREPIIPASMPVILLVNGTSASSSEIVTGALQFHLRALIVGEKTFGKGSVQTIIPLARPAGSALRLTTALYFTPADVTINKVGILPDVEVEMSREDQMALQMQMYRSYESNEGNRNAQNHGSVTGNELKEEEVEDVVLQRAVELLRSEPVFKNLLARYHRDTRETQMAAEDSVGSDEG